MTGLDFGSLPGRLDGWPDKGLPISRIPPARNIPPYLKSENGEEEEELTGMVMNMQPFRDILNAVVLESNVDPDNSNRELLLMQPPLQMIHSPKQNFKVAALLIVESKFIWLEKTGGGFRPP